MKKSILRLSFLPLMFCYLNLPEGFSKACITGLCFGGAFFPSVLEALSETCSHVLVIVYLSELFWKDCAQACASSFLPLPLAIFCSAISSEVLFHPTIETVGSSPGATDGQKPPAGTAWAGSSPLCHTRSLELLAVKGRVAQPRGLIPASHQCWCLLSTSEHWGFGS